MSMENCANTKPKITIIPAKTRVERLDPLSIANSDGAKAKNTSGCIRTRVDRSRRTGEQLRGTGRPLHQTHSKP